MTTQGKGVERARMRFDAKGINVAAGAKMLTREAPMAGKGHVTERVTWTGPNGRK